MLVAKLPLPPLHAAPRRGPARPQKEAGALVTKGKGAPHCLRHVSSANVAAHLSPGWSEAEPRGQAPHRFPPCRGGASLGCSWAGSCLVAVWSSRLARCAPPKEEAGASNAGALPSGSLVTRGQPNHVSSKLLLSLSLLANIAMC